MEPLLAQLRALPGRLAALPAAVRTLVIATVAALVVIGAVAALVARPAPYEVVFANLAPDELTDAQAALRETGVPFRVEGGGRTLAAPADKVYDARMMLAARGIPRAAGVGFELFDKADLGVSEFTQNVNLRRALEGELARTISGLDVIQSARVHITMSKRGLFRDEVEQASASVVVKLYNGRRLSPDQIRGIRHLVSAAVPSLVTERVTLVDQSGTSLSSDDEPAEMVRDTKTRMERDLEARLMGVLELAVAQGKVEARVTADMDASEVETTEQLYDADNPALRSERLRATSHQGETSSGLVGAAANQAGAQPPPQNTGESGKESDELRNYELSTTVKKTSRRIPQLTRLSVAVVVQVPDEKTADVARLTELAKKAVGFNETRGDQMEVLIRQGVETPGAEGADAAPATIAGVPKDWAYAAAGLAGLLVFVVIALLAGRRRRRVEQAADEIKLLSGGKNVAEVERALAGLEEAVDVGDDKDVSAEKALVDRAKNLALTDPARAAHLLHAWVEGDRTSSRGGVTDG